MADQSIENLVKQTIRSVADWPKPGIIFRDITPLFQLPQVHRAIVDCLVKHLSQAPVDIIVGIDARGFILGSVVAYVLNKPFVPVRKKGKLPFETVEQAFTLEYGEAIVQMHKDAVSAGQKVVIVDDLIATGGTMLASISLVRRLGGEVLEAISIIDLPDLGGSQAIQKAGVRLFSLVDFPGH